MKLRTLLLSVFLCTIIVSSGSIISFTYLKYSKSIHKFALGTIERAGLRIAEPIRCIAHESEMLPDLGQLFFQHYPEIDFKNINLITFFMGILKQVHFITTYCIAVPDGSYLLVLNLKLYESEPTAFSPVPKDAAYLALVKNQSIPNARETRAFFNKDFDLLETRQVVADYDPRTRPWYPGAKKAKSLYWSNPHPHYYIKTDTGVSVSQPFYDKTGQLTSIVGVELHLNIFSPFLKEQYLSQHGTAYILDPNGRILLPEKLGNNIHERIVSAAFKIYENNKSPAFFYDFEDETYLASFQDFPTSYDNHWKILFIAPLSDFFADFLLTQRIAVFLSLAVLAIASILIIILSFHISKPIVQLSNEIDRIARLDLESKKRIISHIAEISRIDDSVASMRTAFRSFGHYIPKELAKQLIRKAQEIVLGGEKKTISIFFTDIVNFTSISENLPIEKLSALLTEYFELLTKVILDCGGTIDKYIGDSIMSIWGAPEDLPDFSTRACKAALLCQHRLVALNQQWEKKEKLIFETKMGIKTGPVFVGNLGTSERMNYSAVGDTVNTAARLQAMNKSYHTHIIIDEETLNTAGPHFLVRPLEIVEVRGKKNKLKIYELVAQIDGEPEIRPTPEQMELCTLFTEAYNAFEEGALEKAKTLFLALHEKFPDDYPTQLYLERLGIL